MLRTAVLALAMTATVVATQSPQAPSGDLRDQFARRLTRIASDLDGIMGYAIVDLSSGDRFEHQASRVLATASTIKLAILYELFKQAEEGRVRLDEVRALDRRHAVGGTGVLAELTAPSMPLRDYATLMVVLSDNTATNVLIDTLGMEAITRRMTAIGLPNTRVRRRMIDLEAAKRGDENVSTPAEIARLLELLYRGEGLRKDSQEGLLAILIKPKDTPMRSGIPRAVRVANKPGTLEGISVDAGIVYVPGRPYVFSAFTAYLNDNAAGEAAITAASRAAFDYFNRLATSSEFGRSIR